MGDERDTLIDALGGVAADLLAELAEVTAEGERLRHELEEWVAFETAAETADADDDEAFDRLPTQPVYLLGSTASPSYDLESATLPVARPSTFDTLRCA